MKKTITIIFLLLVQFGNSQEKGINLFHKKTKDTVFLKETRRIKIKTSNGENLAGKFTIVNDSTILIKDKVIQLNSITKIRKASRFSAIATPISVAIGSLLLTGGLAGALVGGYGFVATIVAVPPGLPLAIVPFTACKHRREKYTYEIVD